MGNPVQAVRARLPNEKFKEAVKNSKKQSRFIGSDFYRGITVKEKIIIGIQQRNLPMNWQGNLLGKSPQFGVPKPEISSLMDL